MKLIVNDKEYPVAYANNTIDFTEEEGAMNHFYISLDSESPSDFDELASEFKTRLIVVEEAEGTIFEDNPDVEQVVPHQITLLKESDETELITLTDFIPESMDLTYSDNHEQIHIHFRKEA